MQNACGAAYTRCIEATPITRGTWRTSPSAWMNARPSVRALRGGLGVDPVDPAEHVGAVLAVQPLQRHVSDHRQDPVLAKLLQPAPGRPAQLPLPGQPRIPGRHARDPRTVGSAAQTEAARDQRGIGQRAAALAPRHDHVADLCHGLLVPPAQGDQVAGLIEHGLRVELPLEAAAAEQLPPAGRLDPDREEPRPVPLLGPVSTVRPLVTLRRAVPGPMVRAGQRRAWAHEPPTPGASMISARPVARRNEIIAG